MAENPYSAPYYDPLATDAIDLRPLEPPHSGLGIASFLIGLFIGLGELIVVGWIGYLTVRKPGTITAESPLAIVLGLSMLGGVAVAFLGAGLGIGGLCEKHRKRVFAALGVAINVTILVAFAGLMVLGLAVKK